MFNAGTETTATTIEWAMAELIKKSLSDEESSRRGKESDGWRRQGGRKRPLPNALPKMCNKGDFTLRLHPVAPLLTPKESNAAVMLQGYFIPPKTRVIVNAWAIGTDPTSWERPEEFLPK
ncbi:hypothetical protein AAC387_Pa12g0941 [Persea americana]